MVSKLALVLLVSIVAVGSLRGFGGAMSTSLVGRTSLAVGSIEGVGGTPAPDSNAGSTPRLGSTQSAMSGASALARAARFRKLAQLADETSELLRASVRRIEVEIDDLEAKQVAKRAEAEKALSDLRAREADVEADVRRKNDRTLILALFGVPPIVTAASILDAQNADSLVQTLRASKAAAEQAVADIDVEIGRYRTSKQVAESALSKLRDQEGELVGRLGEPLFDLRRASAVELALLPGVGDAIAAALVEAQKATDLSDFENLVAVSGVGEVRASAIARFVEESNELQWSFEAPVRDEIIDNLRSQRSVVSELRDEAVALDIDLDALADELAASIDEAERIAEQVRRGDEQILKILIDPNPAVAAEKWIRGQAKQRVKKIVRESFGRPDDALEAELLKRLERAISNAVIQ